MFDVEDDRVSLVDLAIRHNAGKDEIELYEQMSIAMELMKKENFEIINENVLPGRVHFEIATPYPDGLPENLGMLFFNADKNFSVNVVEYHDIVNSYSRFFDINFKKL
jgi:hypothetical protein